MHYSWANIALALQTDNIQIQYSNYAYKMSVQFEN